MFHTSEVQVDAGESTVAGEVIVPYKALIEPAPYFYYYVYVTFPLSQWNSDVWGATQNVSVRSPDDVSYEELVAYMSHLKWLVEMSSLPPRERGRLLSRLDSAGEMIDSAFEIGARATTCRYIALRAQLIRYGSLTKPPKIYWPPGYKRTQKLA